MSSQRFASASVSNPKVLREIATAFTSESASLSGALRVTKRASLARPIVTGLSQATHPASAT